MIRGFKLTNFRSYDDAEFELGPTTTLVVGPNASGKTNLLESLYVLASTKSFRGKDLELVRHNQSHFRIEAHMDKTLLALGFSVEGGHHSKKVTHDGVKKTLSSHIGTVQTVLFEPSDLGLINGEPSRRRRYLDFILCQTDPRYLTALNGYKRVLKQRNALLSSFDAGRIKDEIFVWDLKLTELAAEIYQKRVELIDAINAKAKGLYADIAGDEAEIALAYLSPIAGAVYADAFMAALVKNLTSDLAAGFTTIGPHREDFKIRFKGSDMTAVASRGEMRTAVLMLKLAELGYAEAKSGTKPLLLLDDVFSELDHSRRVYLMRRLAGYQTLITSTDADNVTADISTNYHLIRTDHATAKR